MTPLEVALKEYGNEAWPGNATNPQVEKYFDEIGFAFVNDDETPWCAAFMNWVLKKCKKPMTGSLLARSFLKIGTPIFDPQLGDLVIFWRVSFDGIFGHVGLYIRETTQMTYVLGGNQDSAVKIKPFPKSQVLGYRRIV